MGADQEGVEPGRLISSGATLGSEGRHTCRPSRAMADGQAWRALVRTVPVVVRCCPFEQGMRAILKTGQLCGDHPLGAVTFRCIALVAVWLRGAAARSHVATTAVGWAQSCLCWESVSAGVRGGRAHRAPLQLTLQLGPGQ